MNEQIKTQVSAFVDGELPENEAELLLRRMSQDAELRRLAAEYMALSRAIRGEHVVSGMGQLRARIAAAIDHKSMRIDDASVAGNRPRLLRPVAGVAIAATVALAAIFGLQQIVGTPAKDVVLPADTVAAGHGLGYTVPDPDDVQLRQYWLRHAVSSSYLPTELVTLDLSDGTLVEIEPEPDRNPDAAETDFRDDEGRRAR